MAAEGKRPLKVPFRDFEWLLYGLWVAPPGNQAANRENKHQPIVSEETGLLDSFRVYNGYCVKLGCSERVIEDRPQED